MPASGADDPRVATRQAPLTAATFAKGEVLAGKYRIEKVLGRGGMGHVFAATHLELEQLVAIKVMHKELLMDADALMRFGREAKAAAAMRGDYTARIYDVGRLESGQPYLVMEHLEGQDLASLVDNGTHVDIPDALAWIAQACEGVAEAHELGIVHRDIKPHNLFLARDRTGKSAVKVLDFGLAKPLVVDEKRSTVKLDVLLGSPFFMSPEQARNEPVDHRTDIWSLGATLYYILAGAPPFDAPTPSLVCMKLLTEDFPPLGPRRPDAPPALDAFLRRCMNRDLDARFGSVRALLDALRRVEDEPIQEETVRMASSPSWETVPAAVPQPPSSPRFAAAATLPMNAFPAPPHVPAHAPPPPVPVPSRGLWLALAVAVVVASVVLAVGLYFIRLR